MLDVPIDQIPDTGRLTADLLECAYCQGVFPMGDPETGEFHWYQPEPRTIIPLDTFHVPRRLAKTMRREKFRFTVDTAFREIMRRCARWDAPHEAWITPEIVRAYCDLHEAGKAHSLEAWHDGELAGGLYGVSFGAAFMGESMFHEVTDASKASLVKLVELLRANGFTLLDTQFPTPHLARFGIEMIPHDEYLARLDEALALGPRPFELPAPSCPTDLY